MPPSLPRSRVLECAVRLRPFCHGAGLQSETLELPSVDFAAFGSPIVVLQKDDLSVQNAKDMAKLGKLVESLHAYQARVLVPQVQSWEDTRHLLRLGVDLVSVL